jgi:hypothetical protein
MPRLKRSLPLGEESSQRGIRIVTVPGAKIVKIRVFTKVTLRLLATKAQRHKAAPR